MRTLLLPLALATGLYATAQERPTKARQAEQPITIEQSAAQGTASMAKELQLTEEQTTRVGEVYTAHLRNLESVRAVADPTAREARERALNENLVKSYRTILTPEQFARWEKGRTANAAKPHNE